MRVIANIISYLCHPLFLFFYLVVIAYAFDPFGYRIEGQRALGLVFIMSFFTLVLFPLLASVLMRGLQLIPSIKMPDKQHRIGPLIATSVFFIWYYINVKNNVALPLSLQFIALGGAIAVCTAFFINNFSKISLHAVGAGAFLMGIILLYFSTESSFLTLAPLGIGTYRVSSIFAIFFGVLLAGLIGSARLLLRAHRPDDVYGGYLVGFLSQLVAFNIVL